MKRWFRRNALIVSLVMTGLLLYQGYWLRGLYLSSSKQLEKNIYEAMGVADQNELFERIEIVKKKFKDQKFSAGANVEEDSVGHQKYYGNELPNGELSIKQSSEDEVGFNVFKESARTTEKLAAYLQKSLHYTIDTVESLNFQAYDSLLNTELAKINIHKPYKVELIQTSNDSVCDSIPVRSDVNYHGARKYDYLYDMYGKHAFRLYLNNPNKQVLQQMTGILSTSVVIFSIIIFIFIYLLKTIRKMQTEEELKTNFTNNMTHELKTPIAVTYAAVDALLVSSQPVAAERIHKYLGIAKEQLHHLTGLVEQILAMSRKDNKEITIKPEHILLQPLIADIYDRLKLLNSKPVALKTDLQITTVYADKLHLNNMLNNLMENAVKYSGEATEIIIQAEKTGSNITISVEDNGWGIESRYMERIFDKFYRIPTGNLHDVKGFGLGLFYVKEMAARHGGTVEVSSVPGKGSKFTIIIPQ
ncbi:MAG TPA: HAMP domain-containing sensor histidine kinase [Bacteroidales bacterium]|nr:HAMP domain-containing sensor histidine kinase [Bacteroidales bacterium]